MKKKTFLIALTLIISLVSNVYALDSTLPDLRNEIFKESKEIKSLLADSRDVVLMNSMWDSSIMTMTQLNAYFYMLSIFNTIKRENLSEDAIDRLGGWLNEIKKTNELNVKSLNAISQIIEPETKIHMEKLEDYFHRLNSGIDAELEKIFLLKRSLKVLPEGQRN